MNTTQLEKYKMLERLKKAGVTEADAKALRRIAMTLHRWHELECGTDSGYIERDEKTGVPRFCNTRATFLAANDPRAWSVVPDREAGALKRLKAVMKAYSRKFYAYVQGDPRGCALYLVRRRDVPGGSNVEAHYTNGIAIY